MKDHVEHEMEFTPITIGKKSLLEQITIYIEDNAGKKLTLKETASHFGVSVSTVTQLFQKKSQTTFHGFVTQCRMEKARQLLTETDLPIQDVSISCGYTSINSFYKAFQRTFAIAPNAMRKNAQEENEK